MDKLSRERRSWNMSRIRGSNTRPEVLLRSYLHREGFRFRLHAKNLPGRPDIVLPKYRAVVFVHGCFWHRHPGCKFAYTPKSRLEFWSTKFRENIERDHRDEQALRDDGWKVFVVWECEVESAESRRALVRGLRGRANRPQ